MTRILITGASGFIGSALVSRLRADPSFEVRAAARTRAEGVTHPIGDLAGPVDWRLALEGVEQVVHLAGPAHAAIDERQAQRAIVEATADLARQAAEAGVRRFVFVSSIKASADSSKEGLSEAAPPAPASVYGRAKLAAEQRVAAADLDAVILRPPLVYAPNARANWRRLMQLAASGLPLPLASLDNRRSLITLNSLIEALVAVVNAADARAGVYHVADEPAVSAAEMLRALRRGMGKSESLFAAPMLVGVPAQMRESLVIDSDKFRSTFAFSGADTREALVECGRVWSGR